MALYFEVFLYFYTSTLLLITVDDPKLPLHLLIFATETAVTTLTCISEMLSWSSFSPEQKTQLCYLYVPYLALGMFHDHQIDPHLNLISAVFMGVDMFGRLDSVLTRSRIPKGKEA